MGFRALQIAYPLDLGKPAPKAVLLAMAWHACDDCRTSWPGHSLLTADTHLGRTAIKAALATLVLDNWLVIGRFPNGGRGLATEYVVLPSFPVKSTAPCGECRNRMKKGPPPGWFYNLGTTNRPSPDPFVPETGRNPDEKGSPGDHHQSVTIHQSGEAVPRESETSLSLGSGFDHPSDDPAGRRAAQDAVESVRAMTVSGNPETAPQGQQRKAEATGGAL